MKAEQERSVEREGAMAINFQFIEELKKRVERPWEFPKKEQAWRLNIELVKDEIDAILEDQSEENLKLSDIAVNRRALGIMRRLLAQSLEEAPHGE